MILEIRPGVGKDESINFLPEQKRLAKLQSIRSLDQKFEQNHETIERDFVHPPGFANLIVQSMQNITLIFSLLFKDGLGGLHHHPPEATAQPGAAS